VTRDVILQERLSAPEQQLVVGSRLLHADGVSEGIVSELADAAKGDEAVWQVRLEGIV
jgi:hypothetical protein